MEKELDSELRAAFSRVFERSWYIDGKEDEVQTADFLTPMYFVNFLISVHPDVAGHQYMARQLLQAIYNTVQA